MQSEGLGVDGLTITSLALVEFRSHRRAEIAFDGRPVAIWGANGAGKTNILEALSLLSPGRGLRRAASGDLARKPVAAGWKLTATVQGATGPREIETFASADEPRVVRIDGKAAPQSALGRVLRVVWLVPSMDRLWTEAAEGRRRFLDRVTLSFEPDHGSAVLAYDKAMRERNRLLRDGPFDPHWLSALEGQMAQSGVLILANRRSAVARIMAAQISAVDVTGTATAPDGRVTAPSDWDRDAFPVADLAVTGPDGTNQTDDPAAMAAEWADARRRDAAAGRTLAGPHRSDLSAIYRAKAQAADQSSTGEQKALLISIMLANARALAADTGAPPILLLDEVAAHLDAGRRAALYQAIIALGAQAFMTGTDSGLFAGLAGRAQAFEVTETDGLSAISAAVLA